MDVQWTVGCNAGNPDLDIAQIWGLINHRIWSYILHRRKFMNFPG